MKANSVLQVFSLTPRKERRTGIYDEWEKMLDLIVLNLIYRA